MHLSIGLIEYYVVQQVHIIGSLSSTNSEYTPPKWSNKSSESGNKTCEINVVNTAQCELKSLRASLNAIAVFFLLHSHLSLKLKLCYITPSAASSLSSSHSIISSQVYVNFTCACISVAVSILSSSRVRRSLLLFVISMMICDVSIITVLLSGWISLASASQQQRANTSSHKKIKF